MDPGREKCGVAVCGPSGVLARDIVKLADLGSTASRLAGLYNVDAVIVGHQTNSKRVFDILRPLTVRLTAVDERESTLRARRRYFQDHPPRGWRRFWPQSLQVPPEPYDDYAAVVLAEEFLGLTGRTEDPSAKPRRTSRQGSGRFARTLTRRRPYR